MSALTSQELFEILDSLIDKIQLKRYALASSGIIQPEWPLNSKRDVVEFIEQISSGLGDSDRTRFRGNVMAILEDTSGILTVASIERGLIELQGDVNASVVTDIIGNISNAKEEITNSTTELKRAINQLNDLNQLFGTIVVVFNLFTAIVSASTGNFGVLISVIPNILSLSSSSRSVVLSSRASNITDIISKESSRDSDITETDIINEES